MSSSPTDLAVGTLRKQVVELRREIGHLRRAVIVLGASLLVLAVGAALYFLVVRPDTTSERNDQISKLACTVVAPYPDDIPYVKAFRAEYTCPPYDPSVAKRLLPHADTPSPTRSSRATSQPRAEAPVAPTTARVPVARSTQRATGHPHATPAPRAPAPRTTIRTVTAHPTSTASTTTATAAPGLVPALICTVRSLIDPCPSEAPK